MWLVAYQAISSRSHPRLNRPVSILAKNHSFSSCNGLLMCSRENRHVCSISEWVIHVRLFNWNTMFFRISVCKTMHTTTNRSLLDLRILTRYCITVIWIVELLQNWRAHRCSTWYVFTQCLIRPHNKGLLLMFWAPTTDGAPKTIVIDGKIIGFFLYHIRTKYIEVRLRYSTFLTSWN